jgi:hypothetical protein
MRKTRDDLERALQEGACIERVTLVHPGDRSTIDLTIGGERVTWEVDVETAQRALAHVENCRG